VYVVCCLCHVGRQVKMTHQGSTGLGRGLMSTQPPCHSVASMEVEYCGVYVCSCVSVCVCSCVCPQAYLWNYKSILYLFCACYCGCGSVLFWRRCDTSCTSGLWTTSRLHIMSRTTAGFWRLEVKATGSLTVYSQ